MIRVFLIGVVALVALFLVAVNLPGRARPSQPGAEQSQGASISPPRFEGLWEGTLTAYRPDGQVAESLRESRLFTSVGPGERAITITRLLPAGGSEEQSGTDVEAPGGELRRRIQLPGGRVALLSGRRVGSAILWHGQDPASGGQQTLREEIVQTTGGDLYTLDGARVSGQGGQLLILEGRFHRADQAPR